MTTDPDELNYLRVIIAKKRKRNSYWSWPDRPIEELGIASSILRQAGLNVAGIVSREPGQDPPDCEATLDGRFSGVEVTELIDRQTLEQSLRGPEVYLVWDQNALLSALQCRIDAKDRPWKGGPYRCHVLVIHTNEFSLDRETVARFLKGATFRARLLTHVFFGLSYHASDGTSDGCDPVFALSLISGASAGCTGETSEPRGSIAEG